MSSLSGGRNDRESCFNSAAFPTVANLFISTRNSRIRRASRHLSATGSSWPLERRTASKVSVGRSQRKLSVAMWHSCRGFACAFFGLIFVFKGHIGIKETLVSFVSQVGPCTSCNEGGKVSSFQSHLQLFSAPFTGIERPQFLIQNQIDAAREEKGKHQRGSLFFSFWIGGGGGTLVEEMLAYGSRKAMLLDFTTVAKPASDKDSFHGFEDLLVKKVSFS